MTAAPTLARPSRTQPLDVLIADRDAIDAAIDSLRFALPSADGHRAFLLGRYLDAAVERRAEVVAEIASLSIPEIAP